MNYILQERPQVTQRIKNQNPTSCCLWDTQAQNEGMEKGIPCK